MQIIHIMGKHTLLACLISLFVLVVFLGEPRAAGQSNPGADQNLGIDPSQVYEGVRENVNLGTGNVYLELHPLKLPGRNGHDLDISLGYNSQNWHLANQVQTVVLAQGQTGTITNWWWSTASDLVGQHPTGWFGFGEGPGVLSDLQQQVYQTYITGGLPGYWRHEFCDTNFRLLMPNGSVHSFPGMRNHCYYDDGSTDPLAYPNVLVGDTNPFDSVWLRYDVTSAYTLYSADGHHWGPNHADEDANGNEITQWPTYTDTVGRVVQFPFQAPKANGTNPDSIIYNDSNGVQRTIKLNYSTTFTTQGAFSNPPPVANSGQAGTYSMAAMTCSASNPCYSIGVLTSLVLPNGLTYTFHYNNSFGELDQITYPSGGYTRYDYATFQHAAPGGNQPETPSGPWDYREVIARHVCRSAVVPPGTVTYTALGIAPSNTCPVAEDTTTYAPTITSSTDFNTSTTVTDPLGNVTVVEFGEGGSFPSRVYPLEAKRTIYDNSNNLLRTIATTYANNSSCNPPSCFFKTETVTLSNGLVTKTEWDHQIAVRLWGLPVIVSYNDDTGNVTEKREYAYGQGTFGSLVRKTDTVWGYATPGAPFNNRKTSETVYDGSGNKLSQTTYEYDNYTAGLSASGAVQHDSAYGTSFTTRGNVTAVSEWRNTDGVTLTTRMQYGDAGNVVSKTAPSNSPYDSLTRTTTYSYADSWGNSTCTPSGGNAAAYPSKITDPAGLVTKFSYNSCTGTVASATDPNNQVTASSYDLMDRRTQINFPDTGQTSTCFSEVSGSSCYSSANPLAIQTTQKVTSSLSNISTVVLDGLARVTETQLNSDPDCTASGGTKVDTTYDGAEHKATVSNPYCTTSDSTYGITTYQYDALNRTTKVIPPDGTSTSNNVSTTFDIVSSATPPGNCSVVTDQAGKARKSCSDALGRLVQVFEDPSGLNYETDYQYDLLNNLTCVEEHGGATGTGCSAASSNDKTSAWRVRRFGYNSLSQLLNSTNPEIADVNTGQFCTVTYAYDNVGNLYQKTGPKPGQASCSTTTTATFTYDKDNRLTQKSYNDSGTTPTVKFGYDGVALTGCTNTPPTLTDSNPSGRRTAMCDGSGATSWIHDTMGRVLTERRFMPGGGTRSISYTYTPAGSPSTLIYPATGKTITYAYSTAGRAVSAIDSGGNVNYVLNATYAPPGELSAMTNGFTSTSAIHVQNSYNSRLQPLQVFRTTGATLNSTQLAMTTCPGITGNIMHFVYGFGSGTNDNGNVLNIANCRNTNRSQNFTYDALNRIQTAYTTGSIWGESFGSTTNPGGVPATPGIDAWGNLWQRSQITGKTSYEPLSVSATIQNRLTGFGYDAAGNLTSNGSATYTYDGENRLTQTSGWVYTYDGDGKRVKKCASACTTGTLYWTGVGSDTLSESDLSGNMQKEYIYFNGGRVARRDVSANSVHYFFTNQLGSTSVITNNNGSTLEEDLDYYPYGGVASGTPTDHYEFTGKERDTESGLDNFGARYYGSSLGRFMTPDWSSKPQGVPYAVLDDPQSLNLYAYVGNNPLARIDPYGHASCTVDGEHHGSIWCWAHKHGFVETKHEQAQDLKQVLQQTGTTVYKNGKPVDLGKASDKDLLAIGDELRKQSGQAFFAQLNWTPPPLPGYPYMEKPNVTNPELQDIVDKLYQPTDVVPGGTAGAVRYEETTGKLLSPAGHAQKAQDVANELNTFLKNNPGISSNDQATAKELIRDLENAVAGK